MKPLKPHKRQNQMIDPTTRANAYLIIAFTLGMLVAATAAYVIYT